MNSLSTDAVTGLILDCGKDRWLAAAGEAPTTLHNVAERASDEGPVQDGAKGLSDARTGDIAGVKSRAGRGEVVLRVDDVADGGGAEAGERRAGKVGGKGGADRVAHREGLLCEVGGRRMKDGAGEKFGRGRNDEERLDHLGSGRLACERDGGGDRKSVV